MCPPHPIPPFGWLFRSSCLAMVRNSCPPYKTPVFHKGFFDRSSLSALRVFRRASPLGLNFSFALIGRPRPSLHAWSRSWSLPPSAPLRRTPNARPLPMPLAFVETTSPFLLSHCLFITLGKRQSLYSRRSCPCLPRYSSSIYNNKDDRKTAKRNASREIEDYPSLFVINKLWTTADRCEGLCEGSVSRGSDQQTRK